MGFELLDALGQIAREKSVDRQILIETLEAGLSTAAKKKFGPTSTIRIQLDEAHGDLRVYTDRVVVQDVEDPGTQISLDDARDHEPHIQLGETLAIELSMEDFGRNAIQAAKQVLIQRVREAERERVFQEYQGRIGELVHAIVQQVDRGTAIVKLDRAEAAVPPREQMPRDRFRQGEHIRAVLIAVEKASKGPQVILSRTHPDFLRRLFEQEVPEIGEKIVEIKSVAREPGQRSKISVTSHDERVDPVGACVGVKGQRVQAIVRELGGERIDIVPWSADPVIFVSRALSPAKVVSASLRERERRIVVIVTDDQLSLAIGKGGQNARLAAKLTGFRIDLVSESDKASREEEEQALRIEIRSTPHIGPKLAERLEEAGIHTVNELVETPLETLQAIPGVGGATAVKLIELANSVVEEAASRYAAAKTEREEAARAERAEAGDEPAPEEEPAGSETELICEEPAADEALSEEETQTEPDVPSGDRPDASADAKGADR